MITCQLERIEQVFPELDALFPRHWEELALFRDRMPLAPQYAEYVRREHDGRLFLVTVRQDGKIVAYYTANVMPGFHYASTLTGTQDLLYVLPELRGRGLAYPLFRHVEQELRRRGVQVWYAGWKAHAPNELNRLLPALGFEPADVYCAKWIGN